MNATTITIGPGELLDRCTILELKHAHAPDGPFRSQLAEELAALTCARDALRRDPKIKPLEARLADLNRTLWTLEDTLRACERAGRFDATFVEVARRICHTNDARAEVKAQVDAAAGYGRSDVKIYSADAAQ